MYRRNKEEVEALQAKRQQVGAAGGGARPAEPRRGRQTQMPPRSAAPRAPCASRAVRRPPSMPRAPQVEADRQQIAAVIQQLDDKKRNALEATWKKARGRGEGVAAARAGQSMPRGHAVVWSCCRLPAFGAWARLHVS